MSNINNNVLYIGVTGDINRRAFEHLHGGNTRSFCYRYRCNKLVYFEEHNTPIEAIAREKQLKRWKREWKDNLIKSINPDWLDLMVDEI